VIGPGAGTALPALEELFNDEDHELADVAREAVDRIRGPQEPILCALHGAANRQPPLARDRGHSERRAVTYLGPMW
jgi:hypothetical protein